MLLIFPLLSRPLAAAQADKEQFMHECKAFAAMFADLVPKGRVTANDIADAEALADRISQKLQVAGIDTKQLPDAVKAALDTGMAALQGTQVQFLRLKEEKGETRALFRVIGREKTLNYIELVCERRAMRMVKAVDIYNMTTGETLSETLERAALMVGPEPSLLGRLTGKQQAGLARAKAILAVVQLSQAGDHAALLRKYNELPPEVQREKLLVVLRAKSASKVSQGEYLGALRSWRMMYPKDPAVDLIGIDVFFLQGKYDMALEAVERLDGAVGGDPYLDMYRATLHQKMGRDDLAATEKARYLSSVRGTEMEKEAERAQAHALRSSVLNAGVVPPSVRQAARGAVPGAPPSASSKLRLQGVFMSPKDPTAIINGKTLGIGETLDGNTLVKIEASRVTLKNPQGELVNLTYQ